MPSNISRLLKGEGDLPMHILPRIVRILAKHGALNRYFCLYGNVGLNYRLQRYNSAFMQLVWLFSKLLSPWQKCVDVINQRTCILIVAQVSI